MFTSSDPMQVLVHGLADLNSLLVSGQITADEHATRSAAAREEYQRVASRIAPGVRRYDASKDPPPVRSPGTSFGGRPGSTPAP